MTFKGFNLNNRYCHHKLDLMQYCDIGEKMHFKIFSSVIYFREKIYFTDRDNA